jgi:glycosyltransferase involved in cell wall biosynthesis
MPFLDTTLSLIQRDWPPHVPWSPRTQQRLLATERAYLSGATHIFVVGNQVADSVAEYGIPRSRISVVGGGANWPVASSSIAAQSDPVALLVGRDFYRKGGVMLFEAFATVRARVPDAKLQIVGDAPGRVPDGVEVLGNINDRERLKRAYRSARVCVLPALFEPYGLVLTEAMSQGVPCVGTDVGAIAEIIDDGHCGAVVEPGDVQGLASAMTRYLADPSLAGRHGEAARRRVATRLTWDHVARRIVASASHALRMLDIPGDADPNGGSQHTAP